MNPTTLFRSTALSILFLALATSLGSPAAAQEESANVVFEPSIYRAMRFRPVGPVRGGRVTAVTGIAEQTETYFMGTTGGGVWKTTDGGETWNNVTDGYLDVGSIGAADVADSL